MLLLTSLHLRKLRSSQVKRLVWGCTAGRWSWDPNRGRLASELTLRTTGHTAKVRSVCPDLPCIMFPGIRVCLLHCIIPENCLPCVSIFYSTQNDASFSLGISQTFVQLRTQTLFPGDPTHHRNQRYIIKSNTGRRVGTLLSQKQIKFHGTDSPCRC